MKYLAFLLVVAAMIPSANAAIVLDFEDQAQSGTGVVFIGSTYSSGGFQISGTDLSSYRTGDSNFSGSTSLFADSPQQSNSTITLTESTGATFGITSIDLAELFIDSNGNTTYQVQFTGTLAAGGTTNATFTLDGLDASGGLTGSPAPQTFLFDSTFASITQLQWMQGPGAAHQFDNISLTAVPEPSSLVGLGMLLGGVVLRRRRRV